MQTKYCNRCETEKTADEFHRCARIADGLQSECKTCKSERAREKYAASQERRDAVALSRDTRKRELQEAMYSFLINNPCMDCGETDPVVLEFDHVRGEKEHNISKLITATASLHVLVNEIMKCEVVCANCHRRRTAKRGNWYKDRVTQAG